jgi:hypothetical protein
MVRGGAFVAPPDELRWRPAHVLLGFLDIASVLGGRCARGSTSQSKIVTHRPDRMEDGAKRITMVSSLRFRRAGFLRLLLLEFVEFRRPFSMYWLSRRPREASSPVTRDAVWLITGCCPIQHFLDALPDNSSLYQHTLSATLSYSDGNP